jgi:hypothetical protein
MFTYQPHLCYRVPHVIFSLKAIADSQEIFSASLAMRLVRKFAKSGCQLRQVHPLSMNISAYTGQTLVIFRAGDFSIYIEKVQVSFKLESYKTFTFRLEMFSIMKCTQMRTALFWAIKQRVEAILFRRFGIAYRSHLQVCGHLKSREVYADENCALLGY